MKRFKTLILDDEPLSVELLCDYCERSPVIDQYHGFTNPLEAFEFLKRGNVDIVFLDIKMPDVSGLELAKHLHEDTHLVFVTAYREHGPEAFDLNASDYLLKPISYERFDECMEKISRANVKPHRSDKYIVVRANREDQRVYLKEILYVQGIKDYVKIKCTDNQLLVRGSLGTFLQTHSDFVRIHKSYAVYPGNVISIGTQELNCGNTRVPIGAHYKKNLDQIFED